MSDTDIKIGKNFASVPFRQEVEKIKIQSGYLTLLGLGLLVFLWLIIQSFQFNIYPL